MLVSHREGRQEELHVSPPPQSTSAVFPVTPLPPQAGTDVPAASKGQYLVSSSACLGLQPRSLPLQGRLRI